MSTTGRDIAPLEDDLVIAIINDASALSKDKEPSFGVCVQCDQILERVQPGLPDIDTIATKTKDGEQNDPPAVEEFLGEQSTDSYCRAVAKSVGLTASSFSIDHNGLLARRSPIESPFKKSFRRQYAP